MFALVLSATAFAPSGPVSRAVPARTSSVCAGIPGMVGDCAPLGFFDPLGFSKDPERAKFMREAELKHGRVAMFATLGFLTTAGPTGFHPLLDLLGISPGPTPLADAAAIPGVAWVQVLAFIAAVEGFSLILKKSPNYVPGDLLGASEYMDVNDLGWQRYQLAELNNGRLAMFGILGLITESALYGHPLLGLGL